MPRASEFTRAQKRDIAIRANCLCERARWRPGETCKRPGKEFDHITPVGLGGESTLENAAMLCVPCHREKSGQHDLPRMADADLQRDRLVLGIRPKSRPFAKRPKSPRVVADKLPPPPRRSIYQ